MRRKRTILGLLLGLLALPLAASSAQYNPVPKATDWQPTGRYFYPAANNWAFEPIQAVVPPVPAAPAKFARGLKPTPRHKLFGVKQFVPAGTSAPATVAYVPAKLSVWGNDKYGDCVTADEAFNQAACGTFITDTTVISWARSHNYLNGAYLTEVMDSMAKSGFRQGGNTYGVGSYTAVDYANEATLQAALAVAPVKIGIDANALPSGAGNQTGWYATGGRVGEFTNEDHCVPLCGYGTAQALYTALKMPVPGDLKPDQMGYLIFTWGTIGFVDHDWIMSTTFEAFLRNPTQTINSQPQPNPGPPPTPPTPPTPPQPPTPPNPPVPPPVPGVGFTGYLVYADGKLTGVFAGPVPKGDVAETLRAAGVNPAVVADVLALVADLQAKRPFTTVMADVFKILADLQTP